jgi:hypothetical protein
VACLIDDGEDVVEFMRDPAGQPADRFHPLYGQQLLLQLLDLGHLRQAAAQRDELARGCEDGGHRQDDVDDAAVLTGQLQLERLDGALGPQRRQVLLDAKRIGNELGQAPPQHQRHVLHAEHLPERLVTLDHVARGRGRDAAGDVLVEEVPVAVFTRRERVFHLLTVRDVHQRRDADTLAAILGEGTGQLDPHQGPRFCDEAYLFEGARLAPLGRRAAAGVGRCAIGGMHER